MFLSALSSLLSAWFAFILPCYATFKVLSRRPLSETDLQQSAMYWSVIGAFVAFEYLAEWMISWLPFYWEVKMAFLLFLSLPQTQGSTYIYLTYLQPFFVRNEKELDAGIVALQRNGLNFLQAKLTALWELLWSLSAKQRPAPTNQNTSPIPWLSPDVVRSALNMMYPSSGSQPKPSTPDSGIRQPSQPPPLTKDNSPTLPAPLRVSQQSS